MRSARPLFATLAAVAAVGLTAAQPPVPAAPPKFKTEAEKQRRIATLKKQIADLKAKLAPLEAELKAIDPPPPPAEPAGQSKEVPINARDIAVGQVGRWGDGVQIDHLRVMEVIDATSAVLTPVYRGGRTYPFLASKFPTAGLADGKLLDASDCPAWTVTGTKKVGTRTLFVLEPVEKKPQS